MFLRRFGKCVVEKTTIATTTITEKLLSTKEEDQSECWLWWHKFLILFAVFVGGLFSELIFLWYNGRTEIFGKTYLDFTSSFRDFTSSSRDNTERRNRGLENDDFELKITSTPVWDRRRSFEKEEREKRKRVLDETRRVNDEKRKKNNTNIGGEDLRLSDSSF